MAGGGETVHVAIPMEDAASGRLMAAQRRRAGLVARLGGRPGWRWMGGSAGTPRWAPWRGSAPGRVRPGAELVAELGGEAGRQGWGLGAARWRAGWQGRARPRGELVAGWGGQAGCRGLGVWPRAGGGAGWQGRARPGAE